MYAAPRIRWAPSAPSGVWVTPPSSYQPRRNQVVLRASKSSTPSPDARQVASLLWLPSWIWATAWLALSLALLAAGLAAPLLLEAL